MSLNFKNNYKTYLEFIEDVAPKLQPYLVDSIKAAKFQFELDKHTDISKYLYGLLFDYTNNPGKMHRPLTCLAAYLASNSGDEEGMEPVISIACAIENFQSAALIHDDIADCGSLRRGKPCMHITHGEGLAINAGDFGLSMTIGLLIDKLKEYNYNETKILKIIRWLTFMEYMTIEGQAMDLGWAKDKRFDITEADYICMATKKSAYYSAAVPCVLGAVCADANDDVVNALKMFGEKVGLAFQIQDDLLNLIESESSKDQKDFRNDITEGKRTLIVCKTLDLCNENQKQCFVEILKENTKDTNKLAKAVDIMQECGSIAYAKEFTKKLSEEAKGEIEDLLDKSLWKDLLLDMANWAVERGY